MVTPARTPSSIAASAARIAPVAARVVLVVLLLALAVRLHERTGDLERRERSLRESLAAVARRESQNERRERNLDALAGRLEQLYRTTRDLAPTQARAAMDEGVRQAGYLEPTPQVSLNRAEP